MRRYVVPLFAANGVAFLAVGISYFVYSRLLTAEQFGTYSAALAVGNLAVLVLDGGVKAGIIKHSQELSAPEESALLRLMLGFSALLLATLVGCRHLIAMHFPAAANQTNFIAMFAGLYLLTYPWIGLSTARLERNLAYGRLAWIESIATILERGAPALFLYLTDQGLLAFIWGLALGRLTRVLALSALHRVRFIRGTRESYRGVMQIIREGTWYQIGGAASLVRDNLHVLILGPLFGALWVGYYAWGLQLCLIASQIFVQIAARISLPIAAQARNFAIRWDALRQQAGLLAAATAPVLAAALVLAPGIDRQVLGQKWLPALPLLPLLFARMLPGVACTPVGTLLLVERGARTYAAALWLWTSVELVAAVIAAKSLGPGGLAVSYAATAWVGVFALVWGLRRETGHLFIEVSSIILRRPSVWVSVLLVLPYLLDFGAARAWLAQANLGVVAFLAVALVTMAYAADGNLRRAVFRK